MEVPVKWFDVVNSIEKKGYLVYPKDLIAKYVKERTEKEHRENSCKHLLSGNYSFCPDCGKSLRWCKNE